MMVGAMRWTALLLLPVLAGAAEIGGSNVRTVYVMPMAHGLDQYIANQLTRERTLEVIAEPGRADAIFTDRLGESLEYQLEKLHPTPKPAEPEAESHSDKDKSSAKDTAKASKPHTDSASDSDKDDSSAKDTEKAPKTFTDSAPPRASTLGGGKGTLFLVDAHSRVILWSMYEKPARSTPGDLDRTARHVVSRLKQDLAGK
jgi:hypothetical protein